MSSDNKPERKTTIATPGSVWVRKRNERSIEMQYAVIDDRGFPVEIVPAVTIFVGEIAEEFGMTGNLASCNPVTTADSEWRPYADYFACFVAKQLKEVCDRAYETYMESCKRRDIALRSINEFKPGSMIGIFLNTKRAIEALEQR